MFVLIIIGVGAFLDFCSCYLALKRNRGLGKASGLLGVTLIACYLLPLLLSGKAVFTSSAWIDASILLIFHVVVVLAIPLADRTWVCGKPTR